ncbi:hypothetical protein ABH935_004025 [Catenulispora sp. GAS73]|uniref:hypothetical protein n=1 Tax=Catenulispora sp. GAS73 TaxID=3156269 RepID=UPI0035120706
MAIPDPLAVLCALLDRSVQQIAEATADARVFDRGLIIRVADVWDSNTLPLFRAAFGTSGQGAGERAMTALLWMAEFHREWMVEQAAVAGYALEESLPPRSIAGPHRDYQGTVRPSTQPLDADVVEEIATDYDLGAAQLTHIAAERAGLDLTARVSLTVPRRFRAEAPLPASIDLHLSDVTQVEAAATDLQGVAITVAADGLKIALGTNGFAQAATGFLRIDDAAWHLSAAGQRADAEVPPKSDHREQRALPVLKAELSQIAEEAARRLITTMLGIRGVRYVRDIDLQVIFNRCQRYANAGQRILDAARQPTAEQRDAILRRLSAAGGPLPDTQPKVMSASRPSESAAELRMVAYTAAHERHEKYKEELLRHYAVPRSDADHHGPWQISILEDPETSTFSVHTEDFQAGEIRR